MRRQVQRMIDQETKEILAEIRDELTESNRLKQVELSLRVLELERPHDDSFSIDSIMEHIKGFDKL